MKPPFFIVGTQRSGTTLLCHMLDSHPELYVVNEFWDLWPHLFGERRDGDALAALLSSHLRLPAPLPADPLAAPIEQVDRAFAVALADAGKLRWGIKDPRLTYHLEQLRAGFPEAAFLFIVRDPRGVCNSYLRARWNVANVYHGARLWRAEVSRQQAFQQRHPASCHALRFEDLVEDPAGELRQVCRFLRERFDGAMLEYHRRTPRTELHEGNINITRPLEPEIARKWRRQLSARQIAIVESESRDLLTGLDYRPTGRSVKPSWPERKLYEAHQAVVATYRWQQRSRWRGPRRRLARLLGRR